MLKMDILYLCLIHLCILWTRNQWMLEIFESFLYLNSRSFLFNKHRSRFRFVLSDDTARRETRNTQFTEKNPRNSSVIFALKLARGHENEFRPCVRTCL